MMAREYIWLWDVRHGTSIPEIASREKVSIRRVRLGVCRARCMESSAPGDTADDKRVVRPPRLVPLFPIVPYTPQATCAHNRKIPRGSVLCCMVCHQSGIDDHPGLKRNPLTDPKPEPKPERTAGLVAKPARETRKQRRARLFSKAANPLSSSPTITGEL